MIPSLRFPHFICFLLSFYSITSLAQKVELELVAGPAIVSTRVSGDDNDGRTLKIAPLAGVGLHYHHTKHWSIATQLLYERKGVSEKGKVSYHPYAYFNMVFTSYEIDINLNYISLPLMVRYSFGNKTQWYIGAGGFISYLLTARQYNTAYGLYTDKQNFNVTDSYNKVDAGIRMVIGVAIPLTEKLKLISSLNESIGFADISHDNLQSQIEKNIMTNSLCLQVGISYVLSGK